MSRCVRNTGCPMCAHGNKGKTFHPPVSEGRADLVEEWDPKNEKGPDEVTLGSTYRASWICSTSPEHPPWQARVQDRALQGNGCPACGVKNRFKTRVFGADGG